MGQPGEGAGVLGAISHGTSNSAGDAVSGTSSGAWAASAGAGGGGSLGPLFDERRARFLALTAERPLRRGLKAGKVGFL